MKTRKNKKTFKNKKLITQKNKTKRRVNKHSKSNKKINRNIKLHRGGNEKIIKYLFFDKDNYPNVNLDSMFRNTETSQHFSPDDIRNKLTEDNTSKRGRESSALYLTNNSMDTILGYISGYVYEDDGYISLVEFHPSIRGNKLCSLYLSIYIQHNLEIHPNVNTYKLFNVGGERACRCYIKAFKLNNFVLRNNIDCKDTEDEIMIFDAQQNDDYHEE